MLEDNDDDVVLIERVLKKGRLSFVGQQASTRSEFRKSVDSFQPDVILSDHSLPGFNSLDALKICRNELGDTPFILVSGTSSDAFVATCIREGADDYLSKSDLTPLASTIRKALKKRVAEKLKRESINTIRKEFKGLQATNEALDSFAYTITHALRGPLTTLMGLLNVAQQTDDMASMRSLHAMMQTSVSKLDTTLFGLLEYARNTHLNLRNEMIDWPAMVQSILADLEYLDPDNRISKHVHVENTVPFYSDSERIIFILTSVISNAYIHRHKLREHESITGIEVFTSPESALIIVKDNGPGIRAEVMPRIYDMFFRGSSVSTGAGLGLYLARQIVDKLKGTIEITSQEGFGTTVRIELPNKFSETESHT